MNDKYWLLRISRAIGLILLCGASVTACGIGSEKWKEEVQLSDGRIIVVERETIRERGGDEWASNRGGSKPKEYRIRFPQPDGSGTMIEWRSTKISPQTWPEIPLVIDVKPEEVTIFTLVAISNGCEIYSKYFYKDGAWTEEPLPEQFEQRTTNLLFASKRDLPELLELEGKSKRNNEIGHRKSLKQVGPSLKVCG